MDDLQQVHAILKLFPATPTLAESPSYVYFGVILETFAKERLIGKLWRHLAELASSREEQLLIARRLREGLLKASPLVGFPRAINDLTELRAAIQDISPEVQTVLDQDTSLRAPIPKAERITRGKEFWSNVYAQHNDRILHNMSLMSGGDLSEFAVTCIYGDLMAETSILNAKETGLLEFAACYASGAAPQAKGHMYGAHNLGNGRAEIEAVVAMCQKIAQILGHDLNEGDMTFVQKASQW